MSQKTPEGQLHFCAKTLQQLVRNKGNYEHMPDHFIGHKYA